MNSSQVSLSMPKQFKVSRDNFEKHPAGKLNQIEKFQSDDPLNVAEFANLRELRDGI